MVYGVLHKLRHPRHSLRADSLTHISRPYIPSLLIGSLPTPIWTRPFMSPLSWAPRIYSLSLSHVRVCVYLCSYFHFPVFIRRLLLFPPYTSIFFLSLFFFCSIYFVLARVSFISTSLADTRPQSKLLGSPLSFIPLFSTGTHSMYIVGYTQSQKKREKKRS